MPEPITLASLQGRIAALELLVLIKDLGEQLDRGTDIREYATVQVERWKSLGKALSEDGDTEFDQAIERAFDRLSDLIRVIAEPVAEELEKSRHSHSSDEAE